MVGTALVCPFQPSVRPYHPLRELIPHEESEEPCQRHDLREVQKTHKAGAVSGRDGTGRPLEGTLHPHRTLLPQAGKGQTSHRAGTDAPDPFPAELVQPQRPRSRRSALRHGIHEAICWDRPRQREEYQTRRRSASSATFSRPMTLAR